MANGSDRMLKNFIDLLNGDTENLKNKVDGNLVNELHEALTGDPKQLQEKYRNEAYEKYLEKFKFTIHLWKLKDEQWVSRRKRVWERIIEREKIEDSNFVKSYWNEAERFFLRAKPRKNDKEIYLYRRMAYTPFSSIQEIREIFSNEKVSSKRFVHDNLLGYADRIYRAVPEEFHRVQLIADALYSEDYATKKEVMGHNNDELKFIASYPRDAIIRYTSAARNYIKRSDSAYLKKLREIHNQHWTGHERSFSEVTVEYFLKALEYALTNNINEYGGTINNLGVEGVNEICNLIETYSPDIKDENRDRYIEYASEKILRNPLVKEIRNPNK